MRKLTLLAIAVVVIVGILTTAISGSKTDVDEDEFFKLIDSEASQYWRLTDDRKQELSGWILHSARLYDIEPPLVVALISQESGWKNIVAKNGKDIGYMQVRASTARFMHDVYGDPPPNNIARDLIDRPWYNIDRGTLYLRWIQDTYDIEDERFYLVLYNIGHGRVDLYAKPILARAEKLGGQYGSD